MVRFLHVHVRLRMFVLFVTGRQSPDPIHQSYNWKNDSLKYEESQIREMSSWIQTSKQAFKPRMQQTKILILSLLVKCRNKATP